MDKKIILAGMEPFQDFFFNSCLYSSIFSIVQYYSGDIIPFLTNGLGRYVFYDMPERCSLYIKFWHAYSPMDILDKNGIIPHGRLISSDLHADIHSALAQGYPVLIMVDCYNESIRPEYYKKRHVPHYLVVFGFDDPMSQYYILEQDTAENICFFKRVISFEDLENAYRGYLQYLYGDEQTFWYFEQGISEPFPDQTMVYCNNLRQYGDSFVQGYHDLQAFTERFLNIISTNHYLDYADDLISGFNDIIKYLDCKLYLLNKLGTLPEILQILNRIHISWKTIRIIFVKHTLHGFIPDTKKLRIAACLADVQTNASLFWKTVNTLGKEG